jgi:O-antigen/teichoic acid export membrane protein
MGVLIRQGFKGTTVSYFGAIIGAITTIFIFPYFLTTEQIGLTRLLTDSALLFAFFCQFGLSNGIIKFHYLFRTKQLHKVFLTSITLIPLAGFILVSIICFIFKDVLLGMFTKHSPLFTQYMIMILPLGFFMVYQGVFESYSYTLQRITIPKFIREVVIRILLIISIIIFALYQLSITNYVNMLVISYGIASIIIIVYCMRLRMNVEFQHTNESFSRTELKGILSYMLFMFFTGIGSTLAIRIDTMMVGSMVGLGMTGVYSIAFYIASMIEIPSRSIIQITSPVIAEEMKNNNIVRVGSIYKKNALTQLILGCLIIILIWVNIDNIFKIMPKGTEFISGKYVVLFIALAKIVDIVTGFNQQIIVYSKYYRQMVIYILLLALLTICGNYFLIPIYGINGAAIASLVAFIVLNTYAVIFVWYRFKIQPFSKPFIGIILLCLAILTINYFIREFSSVYLDMAFRSVLFGGIFIFIIYISNYSNELNTLINKIFNIKELLNFIRGK